MRMGVFFGSFDPPHIGHTNVIVSALNSGKIDSVLVVPAFQNVWKQSTEFKHRYAMAHEAFGRIPGVFVSEIENNIHNDNPSKYDKGIPTYDVLMALEQDHEVVIITTPETYKEIPMWYNGQEILDKYSFLVVISNVVPFKPRLASVDICYASEIEICSTVIRNKIANKERLEPFVIGDVYKYIKKFKLYV